MLVYGPANLFRPLIWKVWCHPLHTSTKQGFFRSSCSSVQTLPPERSLSLGEASDMMSCTEPTTLSYQTALLEKP